MNCRFINQLVFICLLTSTTIMSEISEEESCEFLEPDYSLPKFAETEEERTLRLEKELFLALNQFDECLESRNNSSQASEEDSSQSSDSQSEEQNETKSDQNESIEVSEERDVKENTGNGSRQNNSNNFKNDDIVAKQLRQLAEEEKDPELKKKYWDKYYEYKGIKRKE